ncbi:MAG: ADP compounds hydrolase NudE [Oceanospirillaceae bacterium]|nr:ADP compounds hydrolase NudE [Oceanospirillaceae bacterium]MCP5350402.1 ADP compounds hydrolase NudE [Oceanospirillaceae bacterium]
MPPKPEILARHVVAQSRLFKIESLEMRFSNGVERTYERLVGGGSGAVMVVALNENNEILLVREYGAGIHDYSLSLPKGAVDLGEEILDAANRELKEEVGFGARQRHLLKPLSSSPSYMTSGIQVVVAWDLYPERLEGDEPEPLELHTWPMDKLYELAMRDDFVEGRAIAAMYLARDWLAQHAPIR